MSTALLVYAAAGIYLAALTYLGARRIALRDAVIVDRSAAAVIFAVVIGAAWPITGLLLAVWLAVFPTGAIAVAIAGLMPPPIPDADVVDAAPAEVSE